jgi:lipopolysaccharide transport system permease protein
VNIKSFKPAKKENISSASEYKIIIQPNSGDWQLVDWRELWRYRDLFYFMVWRDIKTLYAQSILGIGWGVLGPLFNMLIFTTVFGIMIRVDSEGVPYAIFVYTALVPWGYFSNALMSASGSLGGGMGLISKVYFPRVILPLVAVAGKLIDFGIALILLLVLMVWFQVSPTIWIFILPLLILQLTIFALGVGLWAI